MVKLSNGFNLLRWLLKCPSASSWQLNKMVDSPKICCKCFLYFLLPMMSWITAVFNNMTLFLLTRFDSKFDMREAHCWRSNDPYKNSRSSRIEKEWLGNVPLFLKIFNDQVPDPFLPILSRGAWTRRDETRVFFWLRISSKSSVEIKENLLKEAVVLYKVAWSLQVRK